MRPMSSLVEYMHSSQRVPVLYHRLNLCLHTLLFMVEIEKYVNDDTI